MALQDIGVRVLVLGLGEFRRAVGTARDDLDSLEGKVRAVSQTSAGLGTTLTRIGSGLISAGRAMTLGITTPLALLTGALVNAGIQFEDTFAGVAKTVDGVAIGFDEIAAAARDRLGIVVTNMDQAREAAKKLGMQFGDLTPLGMQVREEFRQMALEIPVSTDELNKLGEQVGQLGVKAADVPEVTRLVAELGVATDIAASDAAFGLIRLGNILEGTSLNIVDFTKRAGSALVALGNASVSTEGEILQVALRLAAAGERAGFSEAQIFAWATTITDLGARAEAGGSAVSRALNEMVLAVQTGSDNLTTFATVSEMSVGQFTKLFQDDASKALDTFIKKLEEGIKEGRVTKEMLTDMGLGGVRAIDVIGRLGEAQGILGKNLETANEAWAKAIALQEEAEKRFQTVKSQIQLLKNEFTDLGITIFDLVKDDIKAFIESVREVIQWFKSLDDKTKKTILVIVGVAAAIGPLLIVAGALISAVGVIATGFTALASPVGIAVGALLLFGTAIGSLIGWESIFAAAEPILSAVKDQIEGITSLLPGFTPQQPSTTPRPVSTNVAEKQQEGKSSGIPVSTNVAEQMQGITNESSRAASGFLELWGAVQTAFVIAQDVVKAFVETLSAVVGPELQATFDTLTATLGQFGFTWGDVWEAIKTAIVVVAEIIGAILIVIVGVIAGFIGAMAFAAKAIADTWQATSALLAKVGEGIIRIFAGVVAFFTNVFKGDNEAAGLALQQIWIGIGQVIENTVKAIVVAILGMVYTVINAIYGFMITILGFFQNLFDKLIGHSIVTDLVAGILGAFLELVQMGPKLFDDFVNGVLASANNLLTGIEGLVGNIASKVGGIFSGIFAGGGDTAGGGGGGPAEQFILAIQTAIPQVQAAWDAMMLTLTTSTQAFMLVITANFSALLAELTSDFVILGDTWGILVATMSALIDSMVSSATLAFILMGAAVLQFTGPATATMSLFVTTAMATMQLLSDFWLVIVAQMVHHWLDFVYATLALTAEWSATTQGELMAVGNAFATSADQSKIAWANATASMRSDMNSLQAAQAGATAGFSGVGMAAGSAARAVWIAANNMIAAMKAVLAAATGSPELKIQHPFERFERYLKRTDFGSLVDESMAMPNTSNITTVLPASSASGPNVVDNSVNMGDIVGSPLETKDDVLDTMTKFIRTRGVSGSG